MALQDEALKKEGEIRSPDIEIKNNIPEQQEVKEQTPEIAAQSEIQEQAEVDLSEAEHIAKPAPIPVDELPKKDELTRDIEEILSEDLTDIYLSMPDSRKAAFKQKGEEVASTIKEMMDRGKVEANKVLGLILSWLGMIPGINKYFLQQEAKIKTDRIVDRFEAEMQSRGM